MRQFLAMTVYKNMATNDMLAFGIMVKYNKML